MVQTAKNNSEKTVDTARDAANNVSDLGKRATEKTVDVARETIDKTEDMARTGIRAVEKSVGAAGEVRRVVAQRSAEGTAEFGHAFAGVLKEQTQHNVETLSALTAAIDWEQVAKSVDWKQVVAIQTGYLRVSVERMAQLTQRYLEISQTVMNSATSVMANQAKKAA